MLAGSPVPPPSPGPRDGLNKNKTGLALKRNLNLFFALLTVLLALAAYDFYRKIGKSEEEGFPQWQVYSFDNYHFSLESPMPFSKNKRTLVDTQKVSKKLSIYADSADQSFHLVVECQEYRGSIPQDHMDQFQRKVVGLLQSSETIQNLKLNSGPITYSDQPGIEVAGNYTCQGESYRFETIEVSKGNRSWDLETVYLDKSSMAEEAQRIIQSLKIQD